MDSDMEWIIAQVNRRLGRPETVRDALNLLGQSVNRAADIKASPSEIKAALDEIRLLIAQIRRWERDQRANVESE
jgi:hypothetical protein